MHTFYEQYHPLSEGAVFGNQVPALPSFHLPAAPPKFVLRFHAHSGVGSGVGSQHK